MRSLKEWIVTSNGRSRNVHFVGSIPLHNAREVFAAVSEELDTLAVRMPDGETGERSAWIHFQESILDRTRNLRRTGHYDLEGHRMPTFGLVDANAPIKFGSLRYADEAKASYKTFAEMKARGQIRPETRFQVCLPTPVAIMCAFIDGPSQKHVECAYHERMIEEIKEMITVVPPQELAIQWDVAYEVYINAGWKGSRYHDASGESMLRKLIPLGNAIPAGVHLGFHLCYGDLNHKHFIEPKDLALCVAICNALAKGITRPVNWVHLPVPRNRDDQEFFAPLRSLRIGAETELYLGIIHLTDGIEGFRRRLRSAVKSCSEFGIGTECGFGRRPPETVLDLLKLHALAARDEQASLAD
jgi:hypothetical protein